MKDRDRKKRAKANRMARLRAKAQNKLIDPTGLKGEVFNHNGRIAFAIPPAGMKDAIPFEIMVVHAAMGNMPSWANLLVAGKPCRINPEIAQPPYFRLADCVAAVHQQRPNFPHVANGAFASANFGGIDFVFGIATLEDEQGKPIDVVLIDTLARAQQFEIK